MFSIELSNEAEEDFEKSYEFYYENNPKVADRFFQNINRSFKKIKENPHTFPVCVAFSGDQISTALRFSVGKLESNSQTFGFNSRT